MDVEPIELSNEVEALLSGEALPTSDLHAPNQPKLFGIKEGARTIGVVGIEQHGDVGLIRSLVVDRGFRKTGCGQKLVAKVEAWASEEGIGSLYLLTTTTADYFSRLGYLAIPRTQAPNSIVTTAQFSGLCPESATFMYKILTANKQMPPTTL